MDDKSQLSLSKGLEYLYTHALRILTITGSNVDLMHTDRISNSENLSNDYISLLGALYIYAQTKPIVN